MCSCTRFSLTQPLLWMLDEDLFLFSFLFLFYSLSSHSLMNIYLFYMLCLLRSRTSKYQNYTNRLFLIKRYPGDTRYRGDHETLWRVGPCSLFLGWICSLLVCWTYRQVNEWSLHFVYIYFKAHSIIRRTLFFVASCSMTIFVLTIWICYKFRMGNTG